MKRKLLTGLLCLLMVSVTIIGSLAEVFKDEVVYARLSMTGEAGAVYVVNSFEAQAGEEVTDWGEYAEVLPLDDAESFVYQDGQARFVMREGRFHYQGSLKVGCLPWNIRLAYLLDGQPVSPDLLSGARGCLEIRLSVQPLEDMRAYTDSLTLQLTLTLDGNKCLNIQSERGTRAVSGGDWAISYVILPGQGAEYIITADVNDFSMPGFQAAGIRMTMDEQMYADAARRAMAGTPLESAVGGIMGNFLAGMQGAAPVSFADSRNAVRSLQFVLMGEGIPEAPVIQAQEEPAREETLWDRILRLLGI